MDGAPQPALPVVVLLDIKLPRVRGLEMRKVIRSNQTTQDVRVVTLTLLDETA